MVEEIKAARRNVSVITEENGKIDEMTSLRSCELLLVFSHLRDIRDLLSVAMVCRYWGKVAREPVLWTTFPLRFSTTRALKEFFVALASGHINYVLPCVRLCMELRYPAEEDALNEVDIVLVISLCLKESGVQSWLRRLEDVKLWVKLESDIGGCKTSVRTAIDAVLLDILSFCGSLHQLKLGIDSTRAVHEFRIICENPKTHLRSLALGNLRNTLGWHGNAIANEEATKDFWTGLEKCSCLEQFAGDHTLPLVIHLLGRTSGKTLRSLSVDAIHYDIQDPAPQPQEHFEVLESLSVRQICNREKSQIDLDTVGKTVTWLGVNVAVMSPWQYTAMDSFLSAFVNLRRLYLSVHGYNGYSKRKTYEYHLTTLPSLSAMKHLSSLYIDIMKTPQWMRYDIPAVLENLVNAPLRKLTIMLGSEFGAKAGEEEEVQDRVAVTVGSLFKGRLEELQFIGGCGVSEDALYASFEAIDESSFRPVFHSEMRKFHTVLGKPIGATTACRSKKVLAIGEKISVDVQWS